MAAKQLPVFTRFIDDLRAVWAELPDDEARMNRARGLLKSLLGDPDLLAHSRQWPSTEGRRNLLFYEDPDYGFAINGVVREPGRAGGIHDHAHAWVLYGVLEGHETLERFERLDDGSKPGYAKIRLASANQGGPGDVDLVAPYAIHAEQGGAVRSVAVILRSQRVAGRVLQGGYDMANDTTTQRDGPAQIPFEINVRN
jgi:predicted metal-dependent enzyme (double-stranded beta helix superfamily)